MAIAMRQASGFDPERLLPRREPTRLFPYTEEEIAAIERAAYADGLADAAILRFCQACHKPMFTFCLGELVLERAASNGGGELLRVKVCQGCLDNLSALITDSHRG